MKLAQFQIVRARINPADRDEHPAIIVSGPAMLAASPPRVNVLYGSTRRPGVTPREHHVVLNGADGLDHQTLVSCAHFYQIAPSEITHVFGQVSAARRAEIKRKIKTCFALG